MTARVMGDPVVRVAVVSSLCLILTCVGAVLGPLPAAVLGGISGLTIFLTCWLVTRRMRRDAGL